MSDQHQQNSEIINIDFDMSDLAQVTSAFFAESIELVDDLDSAILKLEEFPEDMIQVNNLFRKVHTLKGALGAIPNGQMMGSLSHEFEALLSRIKKENKVVTKEAVNLFLHASKLLKMLGDDLRNNQESYPEVMGEVIDLIAKFSQFEFPEGSDNVLAQLQTESSARPVKKKKIKKVEADDDDGVWLSQRQLQDMSKLAGELLVLKNLNLLSDTGTADRRAQEFTQNLNKISDQLNTYISQMRKTMAHECFEGVPALVRQAASELNKEVQLSQEGMDLLIDRAQGKDLFECLVHLVRNSIDHGIEDLMDRATNEKPAAGQLKLRLYEKSGTVFLEFSDDGKGLDEERIRQRALQNGLISAEEAERLSPEAIYQYIFKPGFSTKDTVTTISGRGVGMDVVLSTVEKYGGKIHIHSEMGRGTTFTLETPIPQNVMVESTLICLLGDSCVAVPLQSVANITSCDGLILTEVDNIRWCQHSGRTVPLMTYDEYSKRKIDHPLDKIMSWTAVIMRVKDQFVGLLVDRVERQSDLVVRPIDSILGSLPGFKGTSVLSDGKISYVLEPEQVLYLLFSEVKSGSAA